MAELSLPLLLPEIARLDGSLRAELQASLDGKAKPAGALGRLEDLAVRLGEIQGTLAPRLEAVTLLVFAGDHGLNEESVSAYPSAVTAAMVRTLLAGRASANAFAAATNVALLVVDAGVAAELDPHPKLIREKVRSGTRNAAREPALTADEVATALMRGVRIAEHAIEGGADAIVLGEMGIGNSAVAALMMHRLLPAPLDDCVGTGAGQDAAGLARKRATLARAAARSAAAEPFDVLCEFGGLEIVMMAGAALGAAGRRRAVVVDGFIASVAALAAIRLCPEVQGFCIFAHRSAEHGHRNLLAALDAEPLLDLGLRLGEGTGGLLAAPLLRAAARLLSDVATLDEVLSGAV